MKALVTGGAGFIGSHLVDALIDRGDEVLVIDDLSSGRTANLASASGRGAVLAEGSVVDRDFVEEQVSTFAPERIFHLAAQVDVRKAVADPGFDASINVLGTINLLEAARRLSGASFVFASTGGAIYGEGEHRPLPFPESASAAPEAAYGASKLAGEGYVSYYRRLHGLSGVSLRFGNVYGPRQDPHGEAGVVAIFSGLLRQGSPLLVVGDGRQTRDYVYVEDVVAALVAADSAMAENDSGVEGPYNIGRGVEVDVNELAERLSEIAGVDQEVEHLPERPGEVRRVAIDPAAAERDLGWQPVTSLAAGLERTYKALGDD